MANLKDLAKQQPLFTGGHRACAGCGATMIARQVLMAAGPNTVVANATGCLEVVSTIFPYTAWNVPFVHSAFENAAATISGVEALYKSWVRQGKYDKKVNFIAFGGDGGTYDIGLQSLSGAAERGHNILYVCYNNEAYMNTGCQRSGATPRGADTTTEPVGKVKKGKGRLRKPLTEIMIAHRIPYAAQSIAGNWRDLTSKVEKALLIEGPKFINVLQPCRLGWSYDPELTCEVGRIAADTCVWPLYEVVDGSYRITYKPKEKKAVVELIKLQGRFRHLMKPENKPLLDEIQAETDKNWEELLKKEAANQPQGSSAKPA
ncbi:MAG: thiamine pyrophosphate-dependent enzyme [Candidatus Omnitrophota bacterium]|nr:thiamine pyrophosphate-dependent enzyme [Candidatus Omnitrophota bacterium]